MAPAVANPLNMGYKVRDVVCLSDLALRTRLAVRNALKQAYAVDDHPTWHGLTIAAWLTQVLYKTMLEDSKRGVATVHP